MFSLTNSQVIFRSLLPYFPENPLTTEFPGSNFLLPTFSIGSKQDFQVANLPLATVNFEPCGLSYVNVCSGLIVDLLW